MCGSGAGQGICVTTNESTIVARSCLLEKKFLLLQKEAGRRIPRRHGVPVPADRSLPVKLVQFFFLGSPWLVLTSKQIISIN